MTYDKTMTKLRARQFALLALASGALVFTLGSCSAPAEAQEIDGTATAAPMRVEDEVRRVPVTVEAVDRRDFVQYGEYFGEARGISEVVLSTATGGRVTTILAEEGDMVTAGQSLAEIDPERAQTLYETAVLNERLARETWEREQRFLTEGNSFQLKVDQAHLAWLQARSNLLDAQKMREGAFAISPIDGTVVARYIELHDDLEPDQYTFQVADLTRLRISVGVPEADMAGVRELESAQVVFTAYPDRVFAGTPTSFARVRSERTLSYEVDILVDNTDATLLSGQTARVRLALHEYPEVLVVSSGALYTRNDQTYLMVVEDGVAYERPVRVGASDNRFSVILEGVSAGAEIVAEGFNRLSDGSPVEVVR